MEIMKILWFTNTPSLYDADKHHYHGGGWIESLERLVADQNVTLAVSFLHANDNQKKVNNKTTYYPIKRKSAKRNPIKTVVNNWFGRLSDEGFEHEFKNVIEDFQPDVIHVFGTEGAFSKVQTLTDIPVLVHIQGIISPIVNALYPVSISKWDFILNRNYFFKNLLGQSPAFGFERTKKQASREQNFLENAEFVSGRTHWDKMLTKIFNPDVIYYHIDEVLRPPFYLDINPENKRTVPTLRILSTLSPTIYKGIDVVLKIAQQLQLNTDVNFEWQIVGLCNNDNLVKFFENKFKVFHEDLNIRFCGKKNPVELIELMKNSDVFLHPSYIDNSPNSVCEAQIMSLPVIACDVGGVSSIVKHNETGFLVPSNGIFEFTHFLALLSKNEELGMNIGKQARRAAIVRHDKETIIESLFTTYSTLVQKKCKNI